MPSRLTATFASQIQAILMPQLPEKLGLCPANFFVFLVETGFHHVDQPSVELLTSGDLPATTSPSAGITGLSHRARRTCKVSLQCEF